MVWHGMVWYGMVWYGMVWHGLRPISIDQIPRKSLGVYVKVFANKNLKLCIIMIAKNMLSLLIVIYMNKTKSKNRIYIQEALKYIYIYSIGVSIDGLHIISVGTQTPILLLCNLNLFTFKSYTTTWKSWEIWFLIRNAG